MPVGEPSETSGERGHRLRLPAPRQGGRFFGYFLVATRKYLGHPGETGLIYCRQRRHENGFRFYARSLIQIPLVRRLGCVTACFGV